jgi:hypothetical protein
MTKLITILFILISANLFAGDTISTKMLKTMQLNQHVKEHDKFRITVRTKTNSNLFDQIDRLESENPLDVLPVMVRYNIRISCHISNKYKIYVGRDTMTTGLQFNTPLTYIGVRVKF